MQTAPVSPREPPTTTTCPELNLVDPAHRCGASARTSGEISPAEASAGAPSGIPIGATRSSPVWRFPGAIHCPSFAEWKVTVTSAATAEPSTSPVEALTPEAMSVATTGAGEPLIASIAEAAGSRGAPANPVPKIASTTTPAAARAPASSAESTCRAAGNRSRFALASPERSPGGASRRASTASPDSASARAATRPSPPLFPFPQTTAARLEVASPSAASATALPAVSIRSSDGTPCLSIAQPSTDRI
jgi:hypothetical protein